MLSAHLEFWDKFNSYIYFQELHAWVRVFKLFKFYINIDHPCLAINECSILSKNQQQKLNQIFRPYKSTDKWTIIKKFWVRATKKYKLSQNIRNNLAQLPHTLKVTLNGSRKRLNLLNLSHMHVYFLTFYITFFSLFLCQMNRSVLKVNDMKGKNKKIWLEYCYYITGLKIHLTHICSRLFFPFYFLYSFYLQPLYVLHSDSFFVQMMMRWRHSGILMILIAL